MDGLSGSLTYLLNHEKALASIILAVGGCLAILSLACAAVHMTLRSNNKSQSLYWIGGVVVTCVAIIGFFVASVLLGKPYSDLAQQLREAQKK